MSTLSTTKMTSKGQVVIPEDIRKSLNLEAGSQFIVLGDKDVVILKTISKPSMKDFDSLIVRARTQAKKSGLTQSGLDRIIKEVRAEK
jgi:AbrB family looped-hinge helix DNA binding protein